MSSDSDTALQDIDLPGSPISDQARPKSILGNGCLIPFGFVFFAAGSFFLYFMFISPWLQSRAAQSWQSTPCKILDATIEVHHGDDSTTYSAEFEYEYTVDGQRLIGDRYSFASFSSSHGAASAIIQKYPKNSTQTCYYDPNDITQVVLDRDNSNLPIWFVFLPLIFICVGFGIMLAGFGVFGRGKGRGHAISDAMGTTDSVGTSGFASTNVSSNPNKGKLGSYEFPADLADQGWSPPRKLKTTESRLKMLIFIGLFAIFWNGILCFVFGGVAKGEFGWGSIFPLLFSIPFVVVGVGLIAFCGYLLLSMFNPKVEIAMSSGAVELGTEVDLAWEIDGNASRIRKLIIEVHGCQEVRYVRGTDTVTDEQIFELIPVVETDDPMEIAFGNATIEIPGQTMHTFEAENNQIVWRVNVRGEIPWAPDVSESFPFRVTPKA